LKSFFTAHVELIRLFMDDPDQRLRVVRSEPDMRPLLMRLLAGLDGDESNPHIMLCSDAPFESPDQFFDDLLALLAAEVARWKQPLKDVGFQFRLDAEVLATFPPRERFVTYAGALADALPGVIGSVVLILVPDRVADAGKYRKAVEYLAAKTPSEWMKYLVVDELRKPALDGIEEKCPGVLTQDFHFAPAEIEEDVKAELRRGTGLSPSDVRQYTALVAGFAFARREYDEALRLQQQWVDLSARDGEPTEVASACYNLGNTQAARADFAAAEATYGRALDLALDHKMGPLVPMVLSNLGVALYRQGRVEQAMQSFQIARDQCKSQNLLPIEAHVLDCMGKLYESDGKTDEAAGCWHEALAVYDGMTSDTFAEGREGGRAQILEQLDRLGGDPKATADAACCH
ncbi:MAG TPA: tetratricopeptide repeat protein, partial [Gemmataceae bacterium]|nr:tetratricopeptide repeat protein [Gemmataceae bacterium]